MVVNLIKGDELVEEKAICTSVNNVDKLSIKQQKAEFLCKVENIEKPEEYSGLEIVSSDYISGIPNDPILLNPSKVDELIKEGKTKNFTSDDFNIDNISVFNSTSINTTGAEETGKFYLNGVFNPEYKSERPIALKIILVSGELCICLLPKLNGDKTEIQLECIMQEELINSRLMIPQCSILDGYDEIIRINKISTEEEVIIANGNQVE